MQHRPDFRNRIISPPVVSAINNSAVAGEEMIPVIVSPVESRERPERGVQDLATTLALYDWHSRHHTAHITSLRARMGW